MDFNVLFENGNFPFLLKGLSITLTMTFFALILSSIIGLLIGIGGMSKNKTISFLCSVYLAWFRGTPLLVQLMILYYGLSIGLGLDLTATVAGVLGMGMYSGAYVSEIVRGSIQSIEKGQMEAGRSLGLSHWQTMRKIILPQALRRMLPPLANEFIALTKNSSLLSVITVPELMRAGNSIVSSNFKYFEIYIAIAVLYFVVNFMISKIISYFEKRLHAGVARV
ncbi:amino acid ABC transporter permease [Bacillus salipaludis]|uniref:Amino acid ABC transporter permease n=1 Tax=Bacillus salipaludis TaxID=2547811 RepID=A0A4V3AUD6_9BACI|nr:amino acid ABC transporter permease [Bacillus salipaludis]MDQ6594967.1 amino acid ABC transporter permease [Bacillus salipaludis]TDK64159.1 amino acid ABC transporter permease [Bacillus salipaludis]